MKLNTTLFLFFISLLSFHKSRAQEKKYADHFVVAQDGSGDFKTIQEAINGVRDLSQQTVTITVKNGIYHEKLTIPTWKTNIVLTGEDREKTIITNSDHNGKPYEKCNDAYGKDKYFTFTSYTVLVQGQDVTIKNLTIKNESGRTGQAVALHIEGDRCIIQNCNLLGDQDTIYAAVAGSRQYYKDCFVEGTTDFIFGEATAVFQSCTINNKSNSYITAASTRPGTAFGFVFIDCKLTADSAATKVFLGRPWRPYAKTVYVNTYMGAHITGIGWDNWRSAENEKTAYYAEYNSTGPGAAHIADRAKWSRQLSKKEAKKYTLAYIFKGAKDWLPETK